MPRRLNLYSCIMAVCLLLVPITGSATNYPSYQFRSTSGVHSTGAQTNYGAATPSYSFKSTSAYQPTVSTSVYSVEETGTLSGPRRAAKAWSWDEDMEKYDTVGVISKPPVGDVPWLFMALLVLGYVWWKRKRIAESK